MQNCKNSSYDIYQNITDQIIEKLEQGFIPWHKPWSAYGAASSYITRKPYRGINALLMNMLPYEKPYYLTFKQAKDLGGTVRKGSKAVPVIFWNFVFLHADTKKKITEAEARKLPADQVLKSAYLKEYKVFNIDQIDNVEIDIPELILKPENEVLEACENIITGMSNAPAIKNSDAKRAFYTPSSDYVNIPDIKFFDSSEFYYDTLFHELIHSTGHQSRLNRPEITKMNSFGSKDYSKEELVAELGGSFLCGYTGIQNERTLENSTAYIQGWVKKLESDKRFIIEAAAKAQKAADYILNLDRS
ncbi:ArdC family protein [Owenweeksia hongkongensis]|uniref:ArdC family protein n=1 Tax=Owenweeksia hongkongensis TaxID=253245 RepID=UPI003A929C42